MTGLWKYVGAGGQPGHELAGAAGVVQVHRDDLGRLGRRQVDGLVDGDLAAVPGDERVTAPDDLDGAPSSRMRRYSVMARPDARIAVRYVGHAAAAVPAAVQPAAGRSNHMCTWPVPIEFSYSPYCRPGAVHAPLAERPGHLQVVAELRLGPVPQELGHRREHPGVVARPRTRRSARGRPPGPPG